MTENRHSSSVADFESYKMLDIWLAAGFRAGLVKPKCRSPDTLCSTSFVKLNLEQQRNRTPLEAAVSAGFRRAQDTKGAGPRYAPISWQTRHRSLFLEYFVLRWNVAAPPCETVPCFLSWLQEPSIHNFRPIHTQV